MYNNKAFKGFFGGELIYISSRYIGKRFAKEVLLRLRFHSWQLL